MLNLNNNKKKRNWNFLHICKKKNSSVFNLTGNLKLETFDHGTFLYKVHELLLITLQADIKQINILETSKKNGYF